MRVAIAFVDIGGTLINGPPQGPAGRLAAILGLSPEAQEILRAALMTQHWERPESVIDFVCAEFGVSRTAARNAIDQLWAQQQSEASPIAGAESALKALTESGLRLAIISNIWHPYLLAAQRYLGDFIDRFIPPEMRFYSYREGVAKPSEVIFRRALAAAKASPDEAIMIGDSYREDIEPAANLGLNTIWILHRPAKEAPNVVRIMNGCAPCPTRTLSSIADLSLALLGAGASAILGNQLVRRNQ
jgi:FMN phosphatase YigB (HAD superfamily)